MEMLGARDVIVENVTRLGDVPRSEQFEYFVVLVKGSIAVDGISLTVAGVQKKGFHIWIIPHTYENTALRERKVGDAVNLEGDLIGKYVQKFVTSV